MPSFPERRGGDGLEESLDMKTARRTTIIPLRDRGVVGQILAAGAVLLRVVLGRDVEAKPHGIGVGVAPPPSDGRGDSCLRCAVVHARCSSIFGCFRQYEVSLPEGSGCGLLSSGGATRGGTGGLRETSASCVHRNVTCRTRLRHSGEQAN